jgi:hypothetical protein
VKEANDKIQSLTQQLNKTEKLKEEILTKLIKETNSCTPEMVNKSLSEGIITRDDLYQCIPRDIIDRLDNINPPTIEFGETPASIPEGYTEVYFWGIPGSGKTCALAAVLHTAEKMGLLEIALGPGYGYMLSLKNIFTNEDKPALLPASTPTKNIQYLPFSLKEAKEEYARSVSLIELSGEIFNCFLLQNENREFISSDQENTFNSLISFLEGSNRKIHFFFIDYEKKNTVDPANRTQADYLNAAATFFNNQKNDFFGKTTDSIYIVITKSDYMDCKKEERKDNIKSYLNDNIFMGFVNSLKSKCKTNDINGKKLLGIPFSLGKVYFTQLCLFDDTTSRNVLDILMRRIVPQKKTILDEFKNR